MMNTELREWIEAQRKAITTDEPTDYERGQLDTLNAAWQQTKPPRVTRFSTETMLVFGDSPDEIELDAMMRVSAMTGIALADLAIDGTYTLCSLANYERISPSILRPEAQMAQMKGKAHWAQLSVRAYKGVNDDDLAQRSADPADDGSGPGDQAVAAVASGQAPLEAGTA